MAGLDMVITLSRESFLTKTLVGIAKTIFHDIAWQHETFLDDPQTAITLAGVHDTEAQARSSYATA